MSKRPRDQDSESPSPSPTKRYSFHRQTASSPIRTSHRRGSSVSSTPFAYCTRTPLSVPVDSPSNPFGLKRNLIALELPRATGFSHHVPLRFQLVDTRPEATAARRKERGGVYRVVQVPKNYTFRLLHKLILYLFATDIGEAHALQPLSASTSTTRSRAKAPAATKATAKGKGKARASLLRRAEPKPWSGHYFEVQNDLEKLHGVARPGSIKAGGRTTVKLSSVRDRRLFRDLWDTQPGSSTSAVPRAEDEDPTKEEWVWEAEDDYNLLHVWPKGPTLDKGIIYHHRPNVQVHITVNTLTVPARKGVGNTPFVFLAQGAGGSAIRISHVTPAKDGEEMTFDEDEDENETIASTTLPRGAEGLWNRTDAFQKFVRREAERERALQRNHDDAAQATASASAPRAHSRHLSETPSLMTGPSSDDIIPSVSGDESESDSSIYSAVVHSDSALFPFAFSSITPYPTHPLHRKRVERAQRRLSRLTQSGLVDMMSDEEEEKREKKKPRRNHRGPETYARTKVAGRGGAAQRGRGRTMKATQPTGEEWDPFVLSDDAEV